MPVCHFLPGCRGFAKCIWMVCRGSRWRERKFSGRACMFIIRRDGLATGENWVPNTVTVSSDPNCRIVTKWPHHKMCLMLGPLKQAAGLLALTVVLWGQSKSHECSAASAQRHIKVFGHCSVDFDRADASQPECIVMVDGDGTEPLGYPNDKGSDLRVEERQNRIYFRPVHGAMFAAPHDSGRSACEAAHYSERLMRVDDMPSGSHICIRTKEGRYGQMTIETMSGPPTNTVEVNYSVWDVTSKH